MTFLQIQDDALERLDHSTSGSTANRTRIKRFINETYRRILSRANIGERLRDTTGTIAVTASTAEYTVTAKKLRNVYDATNNVYLLPLPSVDAIRIFDPTETLTGQPTHYVARKVGATTIVVRLWPIPSANLTLKTDIEAAVTELSADGDVPILPEDHHYLLSLGARIAEYELKGDSRRRDAVNEFEFGIRELRTDLNRGLGEVIKPGRTAETRISRLGGYFPAD